MKNNFILELKIKKLFGSRNVKFKIINNLSLIIGENGCGKSTILKILNYILNCDYVNLSKIPFQSISLKIGSQRIKINYKDLIVNDKILSVYFRFIVKDIDISKFETFDNFYEFIINNEKLESTLNNGITYLDCENNIDNLLLDDQKVFQDNSYYSIIKNTNIKFIYGSKIYLMLLYSFLSGEKVITQFKRVNKCNLFSFINVDNSFYDFSSFSEDTSNNIINELKKYISSKEFVLINNRLAVKSDEHFDINWLSSGEKKIVQILKCLYNRQEGELLLLDEPELSLSFIWHKHLMKDLVCCSEVAPIIIATHVPIVDNEKDLKYIVPLISNSKKTINQRNNNQKVFLKKDNNNLFNSFDTFTNKILNKKMNKSLGSVVVEYLAQASFSKDFIFVEGISDIDFYSAKLSDNYVKPIFIGCCGKQNVISSLNYLMDQDLLESKNHIHIIDHDYNVVDKEQTKYCNYVFMTKFYSIENYLFIEDNLKIILKEYEISEEDINIIIKKLESFVSEIIDYETLKSLNTNHNINSVKIFPLNSALDLKNGYIIKKEYKNEINSKISGFNVFESSTFLERKKELINNYLLMNGHDLALFFNNHIAVFYNPNMTINNILSNKTLIKKLNVELVPLNDLK